MPSIPVPLFAKCITTQVLVITKLIERKDFVLRGFMISTVPARNCLFKVSNCLVPSPPGIRRGMIFVSSARQGGQLLNFKSHGGDTFRGGR